MRGRASKFRSSNEIANKLPIWFDHFKENVIFSTFWYHQRPSCLSRKDTNLDRIPLLVFFLPLYWMWKSRIFWIWILKRKSRVMVVFVRIEESSVLQPWTLWIAQIHLQLMMAIHDKFTYSWWWPYTSEQGSETTNKTIAGTRSFLFNYLYYKFIERFSFKRSHLWDCLWKWCKTLQFEFIPSFGSKTEL